MVNYRSGASRNVTQTMFNFVGPVSGSPVATNDVLVAVLLLLLVGIVVIRFAIC